MPANLSTLIGISNRLSVDKAISFTATVFPCQMASPLLAMKLKPLDQASGSLRSAREGPGARSIDSYFWFFFTKTLRQTVRAAISVSRSIWSKSSAHGRRMNSSTPMSP